MPLAKGGFGLGDLAAVGCSEGGVFFGLAPGIERFQKVLPGLGAIVRFGRGGTSESSVGSGHGGVAARKGNDAGGSG